jgi:multidrug efflux pump subunit AcrA (membrane-fusion protein)
LVGTAAITPINFVHYIDLQGHIDAENISYISPRMGAGQIKGLYVKKGDAVKKGQLLLRLDDAVIRQQVTASKQGLETIKTQLTYAKDLYNRQNNLWKQGIGTEVQLISARTNVETLEKQLRAAEENIKTVQEQANGANVYSDVDGIADEKGKFVYVAVKEGNKLIARKKAITIGEAYESVVEVKTGLNAGEQLVTEGYQSVYDGQSLRVDVK